MLCFYVGFNIPNYHWYYAPFLFFLGLYASVPMVTRRWAEMVLMAMIVVQLVMAARMTRVPDVRTENYRTLSQWLDRNATPTATVESCEIGEMGWASHRKVIDVLGLTTPKNAEHLAHRDVASWLEEDRPDYIVVHERPFLFEERRCRAPDMKECPSKRETCICFAVRELRTAPTHSDGRLTE